MSRSVIVVSILSISVALLAAMPAPASSSNIETKYQELHQFEVTTVAADPATAPEAARFRSYYSRRFEQYQKPDVIASLDRRDLQALFSATHLVQFFTGDATEATDMARDLAILEQRRAATAQDYSDMHDAYIESRMFAAARKLADRDAGALSAPRLIDKRPPNVRGPSVLSVSSDGSRVTRNLVDLRGTHLVVVVSPYCHFVQRGLGSIRADRSLSAWLKSKAIWIVPPNALFDVRSIAIWNKTNPDVDMVLAYDEREWRFVDRWEMPTFYLVKNGRLVSEVIGWPKGGRVPALRALAHL